MVSNQWPGRQPGGGGEEEGLLNKSDKVRGMLVLSLRGLNCRFWSRLGCLGRKITIFAHSGIA